MDSRVILSLRISGDANAVVFDDWGGEAEGRLQLELRVYVRAFDTATSHRRKPDRWGGCVV